jgi:hypothetical protein
VAEWMITNVPTPLLAVLLIVGIPAAMVVLQAMARRYGQRLSGGGQNEVAGVVVAVIGGMYAILLGLTIVTLWEQYSDATDVVDLEARKLGDVVRDSEALGDNVSQQVRQEATAYAHAVIEEEWNLPVMGPSRTAQGSIDRRLLALRAPEAVDPANRSFLELTLGEVDDLSEARSRRLGLAEQDIPGLMWLTVLAATAVTAGFCLLFDLRDARLHFVLVAGVGAMLGISLFLMLVLDFPFTGALAVAPSGLEEFLRQVGANPETG